MHNLSSILQFPMNFYQNTYRKKCRFSDFSDFLIIVLIIGLLNTVQASIFHLKNVIESDSQLTKSLAISPFDTKIIVGTKNGLIEVFDYQTAKLIKSFNQHTSQILTILWQNDSQGLITISSDAKNNKSLVIQRSSSSYQQLHRWESNEYIYNADGVTTKSDSYIGFNFMNRVQQYNLKTRKKTAVYNATGSRKFIQMSYSSQYNYLYLSGNGHYIYTLKCGSLYGYYYGTKDIISRFQADKHNLQHAPVIYKQQQYGFKILDPNYEYQVKFPAQKMDYYKYCPQDYILGVTLDQKIKIYSRDYYFKQYGVIQTFYDPKVFILSLSCQNDRIIVSTSENKIYVFQLQKPQTKSSDGWILVLIISSTITSGLIILSFLIFRRRKAKTESLKKDSLLSSVEKQSLVL